MITILKGKDITVEWKVVSLDTKQPVDFEGVNAKVFLLAPDNIYTLPFDVARDDFRGLRMTIPTGYISTGVYDLKVIWLKDAMKDKPVYRNVSVKREVFALTDEASEVTYDGDTIKIATGVESCGRDGLSAYEIAVFRGFAKESSEKEWVESLDNVLASEESRVEAEEKRVKAEDDRVKGEALRIRIFTNGEEDRRQSFEISQSNRDTEFQNFLGNKEQSYIAAENKRDSSYYNRELLRDGQFETEERARRATFLNNEQERNKAEEDRKKAEEDRKSTFEENEANRQSTFQSNEDRREEKETLRGIEEEKRDNAETIRKENETKRVDAEISREERTAKAIASIANKVDRTDNAPKLTAGFANNLVGRGEATSEEIGFRPSGGDTSIEDGTARIERIKGNTVVWNQRRRDVQIGEDRDGIKTSYDPTTGLITIENVSRDTAYNTGSTQILLGYIPDGHEVYVSTDKIEEGVVVTDLSAYVGVGKIGALNGSKGIYLRITYAYDFVTKHPIGNKFTLRMNLYDLTQMFGAGNEPTTIEEFNARKPIGIDEYAYNEGELISTTADEIKSVGFNAWDEEWEVGGFFNGIKQNTDNYNATIRSKNYIPILGGAQYYVTAKTSIYANYFDEDRNFIGAAGLGYNKAFTTPDNAAFMWIRGLNNTYGTTYKNDICIHLVHTGYRNGEYEPYKEFRRSLPISEIKDSEGNVLFPNGLLSAGSVYDEITATKAIKRVYALDLGSVNLVRRGGADSNVFFITSKDNSIFKEGLNQTTCSIYLKATNSKEIYEGGDMLVFVGKSGYFVEDIPIVAVRDSRYTNSGDLQQALQGVMLYYALAEPIEVDLPEPLNLDYEVSDFGTEEVLSSEPTTPMKADIIYQFNAVDRIRDNSRHTAEAEELLNAKADKTTVEAAINELTNAIPEVVNDLTTGGADKALSAEMGKELEKRIIKDIKPNNDDTFYITDAQGNIIAKIDKDGLDTLISNPLKERIKSFLPFQEKHDDAFYICDKKGNVVLRIDSNGLDGIISRSVLMKSSKESSWLSGKTFVALGASLSTGGYWQRALAENTGGIFLEDVHKNVPCAFGGSATFGGIMSQQDRAKRLRKYLDDNNVKLDVLLIENANDMSKINQSVDVNTDLPWLWTSTHDYTGYIATSYGDAISNFKNHIAEVLDGIEPSAGVRINLSYSGRTSANVKVNSSATSTGVIVLRVGDREYSIGVTSGMSVKGIVDKIIEWAYEGYTDTIASDKVSVNFASNSGNADVEIISNTTGASLTVTNIQATSYVNYTYKELTTDNWLNPNSWDESWSVETLTRCYKGLVEYLDKYFPDTLVVWVGLPHYLYDFTNGPKREDGSYDIEEFVASKRYVDEDNLYILQKKVCKIYRIPFVDLRENCNISLIKAKNYYNDKDVHPVVSKGAYQLWGEALARLLN